jgi:fucose permease
MKHKLEILCIYLTGLFQGLVLVTVPAASLVFTGSGKFCFSSSEYGLLFIPQVGTAIAASLLGPSFARRWGMKAVYRGGLIFNILAMALIAASQLVSGNHDAAYAFVILGTTFVGAGFGSTLPTINVYAMNFFPNNSASALTVLHTLLGTGTALAPFLVTVLVKGIGWWLLPVFVIVALLILLAGAFLLPLKDERGTSSTAAPLVGPSVFLPVRVRSFMLIVFLYGFCETIFANWAIIFLNKEKGVQIEEAGYALAAFWVMVSVGRLLISILSVWVSPRWVYRILPILITVSLWAVTMATSPMAGILLFALAGLSCSAFFPLSFSFGQKGFESIAERVSGWLMASYMLGYGMAAYGIGKIIELTHASLGSWYLNSTVVALGIVSLSFVLTQEKSVPARVLSSA